MKQVRLSPNRRRFLQGLAALGAIGASAGLLGPALRRLLAHPASAPQPGVEYLPALSRCGITRCGRGNGWFGVRGRSGHELLPHPMG